MKKKKTYDYGKIYYRANSSKRIIAGVIGGILAFAMIVSTIVSSFS